MPSLLKNRYILLAKLESTYNTDPSPVVGTDAMLVENLDVSFPNEVIDRTAINNFLSPVAPIHGRKLARMTFDVEVKGSGSAGTAPALGVLLQGCGFKETVSAGVSVTYTPTSVKTEQKSLTLYAYKDGLLYVATGCRGNCPLTLAAGQPGRFSFVFDGHVVDAQDAALATPTLESTLPPIFVGATFTVASYAAVISAIAYDIGNQVEVPPSVNGADGYGEIQFSGMRTSQGSIDPEAVLVATHDFWSKWEDGTQMAMTAVLGGTAGNICTPSWPKVVYREMQPGERNGIDIFQLPFTAARNAGDDEVSIVFT